MYLACKIFILRSIWTSLVLSLVGPAVSDTSIFANDLYPSDVESDAVPGDDGGNFIMGQFSNSVAPGDNLLADNLLVQSCVSPSSKLRARGQECGSDSADESSDVLNDKIFLTGQDLQDLNDEMLSTDHEVQKYWCEDLLQFGLYLPVCSLDPGAQESYTLLQSTLMTPVNYILCNYDRAYCCTAWTAKESLDLSSLGLTEGVGRVCAKSWRGALGLN